jgi:hypothetical protein
LSLSSAEKLMFSPWVPSLRVVSYKSTGSITNSPFSRKPFCFALIKRNPSRSSIAEATVVPF